MGDTPLILVVEDHPRILDILLRALRDAGFRAVGAATAMEGIRLARQQVPDLILSDVGLPDQDGATAMSCLKDNPEFNDVPLILLSALPHDQLVQKMSECGAVDMIQKPFETSALVASVRHWLAAGAGETPAPAARPQPAPSETSVRKKPFEIVTREIAPGVGELRIEGAIGISSLAQVEAGFNALLARKLYRIVCNLRETQSVYSAGVGCFLAARDEAMRNGGDLVLVAVPAELRKLFTMLGLSRILRTAEDETSALVQLSSARS